MTINEFQIGALRTDSPITPELRERLYACEGHLLDLFSYHAEPGSTAKPIYSADAIKKYIFYGKKPANGFQPFHDETAMMDCPEHVIQILHGILGVLTEAQELMTAVAPFLLGRIVDRRTIEVDLTNIMEEFGDVSWYVAIGSRGAGFDLEEVLVRNQAKLRARYPGKFEEEKAENRNLEGERRALENSLDKNWTDGYVQVEENVALKAHVERLRGALGEVMSAAKSYRSDLLKLSKDESGVILTGFEPGSFMDQEMAQYWSKPDEDRDRHVREADQALASTPEQSLEALRAEAGRERVVRELRQLGKHFLQFTETGNAQARNHWRAVAVACEARFDEIEREGPKE